MWLSSKGAGAWRAAETMALNKPASGPVGCCPPPCAGMPAASSAAASGFAASPGGAGSPPSGLMSAGALKRPWARSASPPVFLPAHLRETPAVPRLIVLAASETLLVASSS